ncbi:glutaminase A [Bacillaceae bacterium S4-13-56]
MKGNVYELQLEDWVQEAEALLNQGEVASYIPALQKVPANCIGISFVDIEGRTIHAGAECQTFTLQSISKVVALALALLDQGEEYVFSKVGMEPTGDPFHSIIKLETSKPSIPLNPMINAGALAVTSMIKGNSADSKINRIKSFIHQILGDDTVDVNEGVAQSEFETAFLNRSLLYFMKQGKVIDGDVEMILDTYTKQCSLEVNIDQLALLGAFFANGGKTIPSGKQLLSEHYAQICKTFMVTCGMYDASGEFAIKVGIPAKSGVSGAIMGSVKGVGGIGVYSPRLNKKGNSVIGLYLMEKLSKRLDLSIF